MGFNLSFGVIKIIDDNIAEIIVNEGVIITLEMCEEYDTFLEEQFPHPFALLVNRLHHYTYTYEAKLHIASLEKLRALAFVTYNKQGVEQTKSLVEIRAADNWVIKEFCGLQMGRKKAITWLVSVLTNPMIKPE